MSYFSFILLFMNIHLALNNFIQLKLLFNARIPNPDSGGGGRPSARRREPRNRRTWAGGRRERAGHALPSQGLPSARAPRARRRAASRAPGDTRKQRRAERLCARRTGPRAHARTSCIDHSF